MLEELSDAGSPTGSPTGSLRSFTPDPNGTARHKARPPVDAEIALRPPLHSFIPELALTPGGKDGTETETAATVLTPKLLPFVLYVSHRTEVTLLVFQPIPLKRAKLLLADPVPATCRLSATFRPQVLRRISRGADPPPTPRTRSGTTLNIILIIHIKNSMKCIHL